MYKEQKINVIIAAAGSGKRFGSSIPKQFLPLGDETVLEKAIKAFDEDEYVDSIYVVTSEEYIKSAEAFRFKFRKIAGVICGGKERQDSVMRGLDKVDSGIVLIHDGARPFVSREVINGVIEGAYIHGASIPTVTPKDTIRTENETLERNKLHCVQTPQGFRTELLKEAYKKAAEEGFIGTDDAGLAERLGNKIYMTAGDYKNIKITTQEDLPKNPTVPRAGTGFDVHRLVEGRKLILGGVDIPFDRGLLGHSDADVLLHAVMDALLGAAALGDIGKHFPDTDEKYKGISSLELLKHVGGLLKENGYMIGNIDATVICQKPKILPYIDEMKENISKALDIYKEQINIKGTTTEKLGFTGREEGIASEAVALICKIQK